MSANGRASASLALRRALLLTNKTIRLPQLPPLCCLPSPTTARRLYRRGGAACCNRSTSTMLTTNIALPAAAAAGCPARAASTSTASAPALAKLSSKELTVYKTGEPRERVAPEKLIFGKTFSDHMLVAAWSSTLGWGHPTIRPYEHFVLSPAASCFHYGMTCFEGMKAFRSQKDGSVRLFRPELNIRRLAKSGARIALPEFDQAEFLTLLKKYVAVESNWVPDQRGYSLYIRPTYIATQPSLGVGPTSDALLYVIASPVGPYYATGFKAVSLLAQSRYIRAWPGGTGDSKLGGNYGPTVPAQMEAASHGCQQVLWLFGPDERLTEVGTMNLFVVLCPSGANEPMELVTAPLDGTILPGVTRASIIELAGEQPKKFKVSERSMTMEELLKALKDGMVAEMFGAGTAAVVSPIRRIHYKDRNYEIPLDPKDPSSEAGPIAKAFSDEIQAIQYGDRGDHPWCVPVTKAAR